MESGAVNAVFFLSLHCFKKTFFCRFYLIMMTPFVFVFQVPLVDQAVPIGSPLAFPGSIMMSSTSVPPGGAPFERTQLAPGKMV